MQTQEKFNKLKLKRLGIDTQKEHVVYMLDECPVCISEGYEALTRIRISHGAYSIVATLNIVKDKALLTKDEVGLSENAIKALMAENGDQITLNHLSALNSFSKVRTKIFGGRMDAKASDEIIDDIVKGNYSNVQLSSFVTACAGHKLDLDEIIYLTLAMIRTGHKLDWKRDIIVDKHCIGGLPGYRTTPIVVSIAAALGLTIPKTSSRAITSPAGTADTMEVLTNVNFSLEEMRKVVEQEGGCLAWGGSVQLSPADDILIRIEKALDLDSEGQLIASVLSKKVAAGSTHVVIDIPVGETAKIRTMEAAKTLSDRMILVGDAIGIKVKTLITDGSSPVGRGIGPSLEAMDVLAVLRNEENAPKDLKQRALDLAAAVIEIAGIAKEGNGIKKAEEILESGKAWEKFHAICLAQGRFSEPEYAAFNHDFNAPVSGTIKRIDNRKLARVAKLAGAPNDPKAGIKLHHNLNESVEQNAPLFTIYAESKGELQYALDYLHSQNDIITIA